MKNRKHATNRWTLDKPDASSSTERTNPMSDQAIPALQQTTIIRSPFRLTALPGLQRLCALAGNFRKRQAYRELLDNPNYLLDDVGLSGTKLRAAIRAAGGGVSSGKPPKGEAPQTNTWR
ncbi:hypothetical protein SIAM614_01169 [Stappia aggregata IAM 12614]|uniref:Uncharacterized protein n=2 Tax=Roseibium aggregatum TaxID=187304 RepID=A0P0P4_ROSAI|nr:hypothetical protein SIAM614_01169 [Stappia aggregata IAM 12614] [Roseibium aggregatum IAM 12614]